MDKTVWTSDVPQTTEAGSLDMVGVQIVLLIDQTRLQKGVSLHLANENNGPQQIAERRLTSR